MHNKLRRDIEAFLTFGAPTPDPDPTSLLQRALTALGGPVENNRPDVVLRVYAGAIADLTVPSPLPDFTVGTGEADETENA